MNTDQVKNITDIYPCRIYSFLISQNGTDDPVVTELKNTLGVDVVWTRTTQGVFQGVYSAAPVGNNPVSEQDQTTCFNAGSAIPYSLTVQFVAATKIVVATYDPAFASLDGALDTKFIEVKLYP